MKCSHGLPFESKCSGCFEDAMKRVSASQPKTDGEFRGVVESKKIFVLGDIQMGIDKNPRPL